MNRQELVDFAVKEPYDFKEVERLHDLLPAKYQNELVLELLCTEAKRTGLGLVGFIPTLRLAKENGMENAVLGFIDLPEYMIQQI